jgi:LPS sulfotransferase NodH/outer membrane protein assembly factor BamB/orotate phosphoribosyltransferase
MDRHLDMQSPPRASPAAAAALPASSAPTLTYVICSVPRTGSTPLAQALAATGRAGRPDEYFDPHREIEDRWIARLNIRDDGEYLDRVIAAATTPNGICGLKVYWHQLDCFRSKTSAAFKQTIARSPGTPPAGLMRARFGEMRHLWLRRRDKVAQAISCCREGQTGLQRSADAAARPERPTHVDFDFNAIDRLVEECAQFDRDWETHFRQHGLKPLVVTYEDFVANDVATLREVLAFLGLPPQPPVARARLERRPDAESLAWAAQYRAMKAAAGTNGRSHSISVRDVVAPVQLPPSAGATARPGQAGGVTGPARQADVVPSLTYLVCGAARSGSTLLCDTLASTGVAGRPDEYFHGEGTDMEAYWMQRMGIDDRRDYVDAIVREGTTPNGIFGVKVLWGRAEDLRSKLVENLAPSRPNLRDASLERLLREKFGAMRYVWLRRRNLVAQGISYYRARETGVWRAVKGRRDQVGPLDQALEFDFAKIDRAIAYIRDCDFRWRDYFLRHRITPLVQTYEEVVADLDTSVRGILHFLNIPHEGVVVAEADLERQADERSLEWEERYCAVTDSSTSLHVATAALPAAMAADPAADAMSPRGAPAAPQDTPAALSKTKAAEEKQPRARKVEPALEEQNKLALEEFIENRARIGNQPPDDDSSLFDVPEPYRDGWSVPETPSVRPTLADPRLARLFEIIEAKSVLRGPGPRITSSGGGRGKWLIDLRKTFFDPVGLDLVAELFWDRFADKLPFQVCGVEMAAIPLITAIMAKGLQRGTPVNGFAVRKERKPYGLTRTYEGEATDEPIVVVDDVINTGSTQEKARVVVAETGRSIREAFVVVDYGTEYGCDWLARHNIGLTSLFQLSDFDLPMPPSRPAPVRATFELAWRCAAEEPNFFDIVPKSTPALDDRHVYYGSDCGELWAADLASGDLRWRFRARNPGRRQIFSSAAVHDGRVYFGNYGGNVYCLDAATGEEIWRFRGADWVGSSPAVAPDLGMLLIGLEHELDGRCGSVVALDLASGAKIWEYAVEKRLNGSPAYSPERQLVAIGTNDGDLLLIEPRSHSLRWRYPAGGAVRYAPAFDLARGSVICGSFDGAIHVVDIETAEQAWRVQTADIVHSTPLVVGDRAYVASTDKFLYVLDLAERRVVDKIYTSARNFASPRLIEGRVYFAATSGVIFELDPVSLQITGETRLPDRITNAVTYSPQSGLFYAMTFDTTLYAFRRIGQ